MGGDLRRSICAAEPLGPRIRIAKRAPVISYGEEADDILLTARRAPDAAAADQVLVLARKPDLHLTRTGEVGEGTSRSSLLRDVHASGGERHGTAGRGPSQRSLR